MGESAREGFTERLLRDCQDRMSDFRGFYMGNSDYSGRREEEAEGGYLHEDLGG